MERSKLTGLEWGRAFAAVAVVAWHTHAVGQSTVFTPEYEGGVDDVSGVVYFNVLLLAVPVFMSISLFLYVRQRDRGTTTLSRRVRRLGFLSVFWIAVITMTRGFGDVDISESPEFVLSGGHSIFYFFVQLLLMTILAEAALALGLSRRPRLVILCLVGSTALFVLRSRIAGHLPGGDLVTLYWGALNFPPYVFAMLGLHMALERGWRLRARHLVVCLVGYLALAGLEWAVLTLETFGTRPAAYARPSLVLGATAIMAVLVTRRWGQWRPAMLLAELSLAIYCVHILILEHLESIVPSLAPADAHAGPLAFLATLGLTLPIAYALRRRIAV